MINKIISGGQTGADRAALDVAINMNIFHGGWIPKGRKTEDGTLAEKYHLQEMPTAIYSKRTEQNVLDSDGTLIISHGKLNGGSALTCKLANQNGKDWLHIDLDTTRGFSAAQTIKSWIITNDIHVLNVAGPRASKDPEIYDDTVRLLTAVLNLFFVDSKKFERLKPLYPRTVKDAVDRLIAELPMKQKASIAKMNEDDLIYLHPTLGGYIRNNYGLWINNGELMKDCRYLAKDKCLDEDSASFLIVKQFWKSLKNTHMLRIVK